MAYNAKELLDTLTPDDGFNAVLEKCRLTAICGRPYIRVQTMRQWLRRDSQEPGQTELHRLLRRVHNRADGFVSLEHMLSNGRDRIDLVFSILFILGRGDLLGDFIQLGIVDNMLGEHPLATLVADLDYLKDGQELAAKFDCLQWSFAPMMIEMKSLRVRKQVIVPIHKWSPLKPVQRGGTSKLYFIEVFPEFLSESVKMHIEWSRKPNAPDGLGPRYHLVMKSLLTGSDSFYANEVNNLRSLANTKGVVRYLGSFKHLGWPIIDSDHAASSSLGAVDGIIGTRDRTTCHIFFEFGDFDLLDLFERFHPAHHMEVTGTWRNLFTLATALKDVHELGVLVNDVTEKASAIHGDIKPENIISVQEQLKLADLGFSKVMHRSPDREASAHIAGLTQIYAAPECLQVGLFLPQSIDIWSLGCVFSLAATWIIRGHVGYTDFARLRETAVREIVKHQKAAGQTPILTPGSYFHDGEKVLQVVKDWHTMLRSSLRIGDNLTPKVLDIIEQDMLVPDRHPQRRITAKELVQKLKNLVDADLAQESGIPKTIQDFFDDLQDDVADQARQSEKREDLATSHAIKSNKHRKIDIHRLGYVTTRIPIPRVTENVLSLSPQVVPTPRNRAPSIQVVMAGPSTTRTHGPTQTSQDIPPPDAEHPIVTREDISQSRRLGDSLEDAFSPSTTGTSGRNRKRRKPMRPANAWQARGKMRQLKLLQGPSSPLPKISKTGKRNPDERLQDFYKDRDIIFLIDNQGSMAPFWDETRWIFKTLLKISRGIDQDGVDVFFTCSEFQKPQEKNQDKMERALVGAFDRKDLAPKAGAVTDMITVLSQRFNDYLEKIKNHSIPHHDTTTKKSSRRLSYKKQPTQDAAVLRDATLVILTNGVWPNCQRAEFERIFKDFTTELRNNNLVIDDKIRPYSVEFVRFGEDEEGIELLEHLDDDLKFDGIFDIVDTEEARGGDVYKMMLGSFVYDYDDLDGFVPPEEEGNGDLRSHNHVNPMSRHITPPYRVLPPSPQSLSPESDISRSHTSGFPIRPNVARPSALKTSGASPFGPPLAPSLSTRSSGHQRRASFKEEDQASAGYG